MRRYNNIVLDPMTSYFGNQKEINEGVTSVYTYIIIESYFDLHRLVSILKCRLDIRFVHIVTPLWFTVFSVFKVFTAGSEHIQIQALDVSLTCYFLLLREAFEMPFLCLKIYFIITNTGFCQHGAHNDIRNTSIHSNKKQNGIKISKNPEID